MARVWLARAECLVAFHGYTLGAVAYFEECLIGNMSCFQKE